LRNIIQDENIADDVFVTEPFVVLLS